MNRKEFVESHKLCMTSLDEMSEMYGNVTCERLSLAWGVIDNPFVPKGGFRCLLAAAATSQDCPGNLVGSTRS